MTDQDEKTTGPGQPGPKTYSVRDVRQGEVILRHRWSRWIFFGGLAGLVLLLAILGVAGGGRGG